MAIMTKEDTEMAKEAKIRSFAPEWSPEPDLISPSPRSLQNVPWPKRLCAVPSLLC